MGLLIWRAPCNRTRPNQLKAGSLIWSVGFKEWTQNGGAHKGQENLGVRVKDISGSGLRKIKSFRARVKEISCSGLRKFWGQC